MIKKRFVWRKGLSCLALIIGTLLSCVMGGSAQAVSECTHEQWSEVHDAGAIYGICDLCGETIGTKGYCMDRDGDQDGLCDICEYDLRFRGYSGEFYESMDQAAAGMRKILQKRDRESYVFFEIDEADYHSSELTFQFEDALFRHTGVYNEGDYLNSSFLMAGYAPSFFQYAGRYYCGQKMHQFPCATTGEQESALYAKIGALISENGWANLTGYDQIKAVYDWVCENVAYDHAHYAECSSFAHLDQLSEPIQPDALPHMAYNAVFEGKAVCSGYAQLLYMIYNRLGVDCRMISGTANGGAHGWNIVELEDQYYFVDATWDAELSQAGGEYAYFLRAKANMADHYTDDAVLEKYNIARNDYGYTPGDASGVIESGEMDGVEWTLTSDGTLTFSGEGVIKRNPVTDRSLIEKVVLGDGIREIGSIDEATWRAGRAAAVFGSCSNLKSVEFGSGLTLIGDQTFEWCESLTELTIPDNVTDIGYQAFRRCENLRSVSLPEGLEMLRIGLFSACYGLADITIPESVTEIEGNAFEYCQALETLILPSALERLGDGVFYECSALETIEIPAGIKELKFYLFFNCSSLASVTLNDGLEIIDDAVFHGCESLTDLELPETVTTLGEHCFTLSGLRTLVLPTSMTSIPMHLFDSCKSLESIVIPEPVTEIGIYAFAGCDALEEIVLPDSVTKLGQCAFSGCTNLQKVVFPAALKEIGYSAFDSCWSLTELVLPDQVETIGQSAFRRCIALTDIEIPESVTSISDDAFEGCKLLVATVAANSYAQQWCEENGVRWRCTVCTETIEPAVAATCTETGLTEGRYCSACGEVFAAQEVVAALGHAEEVLSGKEATWNEDGLTEGKQCITCGTITVPQEVIPATGINTKPNHGNCGYSCGTQLRSDSGCGYTWIENEKTYVCDGPCYDHYTNYGYQKHTAMISHSSMAYAADHEGRAGWNQTIEMWQPCVGETIVAPTCTEDGYSEGKCVHCHVNISGKYNIVPALGHTEVLLDGRAPTCTLEGKSQSSYCAVCTIMIKEQEVIPATGHVEVIDAAVAATCTETGLTEGKHCSVCEEELVKQEVVAALGHTEAIDAAVAPTCTETGLTEGKHCSVCGDELVKQEVVAALGHTEVIDAAVAATCTETGLTEGKHCSVCNEILAAQEVVAALGHTEVIDAAVAPTCTETGLTEGKHCSVCHEVLIAQTVIPATGHAISLDQSLIETVEDGEAFQLRVVVNCGHDVPVDVFVSGGLMLVGRQGDTVTCQGEACSFAKVVAISADQYMTSAACNVIVHAQEPLILPAALTEISGEAFAGMPVKEVVVGENVRFIGEKAFENCADLMLITIPNTVETIGEEAFLGCENLMILCPEGSAASEYTKENELPCFHVPAADEVDEP